MSQSRSIRGDTLHVTIVDGNDSVMATRTTPLAPGTNYSDIMVNEIGYGAHQTIDPVYKLRIADMDSLFRLSLRRKGINLEVASVLSVDSDNKLVAGDARLRSAAGLDSITVCYNLLSGESYVAYFSPRQIYIRSHEGDSAFHRSYYIAYSNGVYVSVSHRLAVAHHRGDER